MVDAVVGAVATAVVVDVVVAADDVIVVVVYLRDLSPPIVSLRLMTFPARFAGRPAGPEPRAPTAEERDVRIGGVLLLEKGSLV